MRMMLAVMIISQQLQQLAMAGHLLETDVMMTGNLEDLLNPLPELVAGRTADSSQTTRQGHTSLPTAGHLPCHIFLHRQRSIVVLDHHTVR